MRPFASFDSIAGYLGAAKKTGVCSVDISYDDYSDTMLPEGIEAVPRRFAITWRNKWMLRQAEYVVTYVTHSWGGAAQFAEMAEKKEKIVLSLAN